MPKELISGALDFVNTLLQLANTDLGQIITLFTVLAGGGTGLVSLVNVSHIIPVIGNQFKNFSKVIKATSTGVSTLGGALKAVGGGAGALAGAMSSALPVILGVSAAIALVVGAVKLFDHLFPSLEDVQAELEEVNTQYEDNQARLQELNEIPYYERTPEIIEEKQALEEENEELKRQIEYWEELEEQKKKDWAENYANKGIDVQESVDYGDSGYTLTDLPEQFKSFLYSVDEVTGEMLDHIHFDTFEELQGWLSNNIPEAAGKTIDELEKMGFAFGDATKTVRYAGEDLENYYVRSVANLLSNVKDATKATDDQVLQYYELKEGIEELISAYSILGEDTSYWENVLNALNQRFYAYTGNIDIYNTEIVALGYSVEQLANEYPQLTNYMDDANGVTTINIQRLLSQQNQTLETKKELAKLVATITTFNDTQLSVRSKLMNLRAIALAAGATSEAIQLLTSSSSDPYESAELASAFAQNLSLHNGSIEAVFNAIIDGIDKVKEEEDDDLSGTGSSATKQLVDKAKEQFDIYYKDLQHKRNLDEIDEEEYLNELRKLVDNYIEDATNNMKEYGLTHDEIVRNMYQYEEELYDGWKEREEEKLEKIKETQESLISDLEDEISVYEKLFGYMTSKIEDQIELLEGKKEAITDYWDQEIEKLKESNEELEKQIELEEILDNLARAKQKKVLVFKDGRFQYIQDVDEVNEAQVKLEEYQREAALQQEVDKLEQLKNEAIASIDKQIEIWKTYKEEWSAVVDYYSEESDRFLIEQKLKISLENENWQTSLNNLSSYIAQYKALLAQLTQAEKDLSKIENGESLEGIENSSSISSPSGSNIGNTQINDNGWVMDGTVTVDKSGTGGNSVPVWYDPVTNKVMTSGLGPGDIIHTAGGDYMITGGTAGNYESTPYQGGTLQEAISSNNSSSSSNSSIGSTIISGVNNIISNILNGLTKHGDGSLQTNAGLSIVGENGPELRVLGTDGIIPYSITKNLWAWGSLNPNDLNSDSNFSRDKEVVNQFIFENLTLPNIEDGIGFINYIKDNFWRKTVQMYTKS